MQDVKQDEHGCSSGCESPQSEALQSLLASQVALVQAISAQTLGMAAMTENIRLLIEAMAEAEGVDPEDVPAKVGLNGRPI